MRSTHAIGSAFIPASPEYVFATLLAVDRYSLWWPVALRVRVVSPPPHGLASVVEIRALGSRFRCRITAVESPSRLAVEYVAGPHRGRGSWTLESEDEGTRATYTISLVPHGPMARTLSHVVDFAALHSRQMRGVLGRLAQTLAKDDVSA